MSLSNRERERYSRHLLVPELGESGQERLLATKVRFAPSAHAFVSEVATAYLEASGVEVARHDERGVPVMLASARCVAQCAGRPELEQVEAAVLGTLAALDVVRGVLGWEARR